MEKTLPDMEQASFITLLFRTLHARQKELGLTNETLMQLTKIPHTTFYRIWHDGDVDVHMDFIYIQKFCAAFEVELTFQLPGAPAKTADSGSQIKEEILENTAELLTQRKQEIENRGSEIASLTEQLAAKQAELDALREEHMRLALSVAETLKSAQDQSNEIIRGLLSRIEDLQTELLRNREKK